MMVRVFILGIVWPMLAVPATAGAQDSDAERARAFEMAVEAQAHFEAGESDVAVQLLLNARQIYPEPVLLYNLGRVYDTMGLALESDALAAYEQYVEAAPDATDRAAVEQRIASLRAAQTERDNLAAARDAERTGREAAEEQARLARRPSPVPWILIATGGAAVAGGGVVAGLARRANSDALDAVIHERAVASSEQANRLATTANILFVVGGAISLTGAIWLITDRRRRSVELSVGPGHIQVEGRW